MEICIKYKRTKMNRNKPSWVDIRIVYTVKELITMLSATPEDVGDVTT